MLTPEERKTLVELLSRTSTRGEFKKVNSRLDDYLRQSPNAPKPLYKIGKSYIYDIDEVIDNWTTRAYHYWRPSEILKAQRLRESGLNNAQIGLRLNRTRNSVAGMFHYHAKRNRRAS